MAEALEKWPIDLFSRLLPRIYQIVQEIDRRFLIKVNEMLGLQLASIHNLAFYLWLVKEARKHIIAGDFTTWKSEMVRQLSNRL